MKNNQQEQLFRKLTKSVELSDEEMVKIIGGAYMNVVEETQAERLRPANEFYSVIFGVMDASIN